MMNVENRSNESNINYRSVFGHKKLEWLYHVKVLLCNLPEIYL